MQSCPQKEPKKQKKAAWTCNSVQADGLFYVIWFLNHMMLQKQFHFIFFVGKSFLQIQMSSLFTTIKP